MKLSDLINLIHYKNYQFEIELKGKVMLRRPIAEILEHHENLEEYFKHIAKLHNESHLQVHLFSKNGSSIKRRGNFLVEIPGVAERNEPVATSNETVAGSNNHVAEPNDEPKICPVHGLGGIQQHYQPQQTLSNYMDTHSQILQVRLEHAQDKISDLDRRNKELERKNDELYNENLKLVREHAVHKDKLDLEYQKKELELSSEKSQGLSGIMDKVSGLPPEAFQLIAGFFPNHPLAKGISGTDQPQLPAAKVHADPTANSTITIIHEFLLRQSPETVGKISMLLDKIISEPARMDQILTQLYSHN